MFEIQTTWRRESLGHSRRRVLVLNAVDLQAGIITAVRVAMAAVPREVEIVRTTVENFIRVEFDEIG